MIKHSFTALGALTQALGSPALTQPAMAAGGAHQTFQTGGPYHAGAPGSRVSHASVGNRLLDCRADRDLGRRVSKKISANDSSAEAVMEMAANSLTKFGTDPWLNGCLA